MVAVHPNPPLRGPDLHPRGPAPPGPSSCPAPPVLAPQPCSPPCTPGSCTPGTLLPCVCTPTMHPGGHIQPCTPLCPPPPTAGPAGEDIAGQPITNLKGLLPRPPPGWHSWGEHSWGEHSWSHPGFAEFRLPRFWGEIGKADTQGPPPPAQPPAPPPLGSPTEGTQGGGQVTAPHPAGPGPDPAHSGSPKGAAATAPRCLFPLLSPKNPRKYGRKWGCHGIVLPPHPTALPGPVPSQDG